MGEYGLIALLLALPVVYGIQDISQDGSLARLGNNIVDGLSNGAIWALVALGYTMVYGIIELINFAHGDVFMVGVFVSMSLLIGLFGVDVRTSISDPLPLAFILVSVFLLTMVIMGTIGVVIERF